MFAKYEVRMSVGAWDEKWVRSPHATRRARR
jgi:hypothetical protein